MKSEKRWLKGKLLVAAPSLLDGNFHQAVVLMIAHSEEGAAGIILNRPTGKTIRDVWKQAFQESSDWEKPIHLGGPVDGPVTALHALEHLSDDEVIPDLYSTTDPDKLEAIVSDKLEPSRFYANYAGWGPGQLERELKEGSWLVAPANLEHVFEIDAADLWKKVLGQIGYSELFSSLGALEIPEDPNLN